MAREQKKQHQQQEACLSNADLIMKLYTEFSKKLNNIKKQITLTDETTVAEVEVGKPAQLSEFGRDSP